jgi:Holliday junction resolvase
MSAPGYLYFVELKNRSTPTQRFSKEEVHDLVEAADRAGATPVLISRPDLRKYDHSHCFFPEDLKENKKSYSVTQNQLPGMTIESLFSGE